MNLFLLFACSTQEPQSSTVEETPVADTVHSTPVNWNVLLTGSLNGEYEPCG